MWSDEQSLELISLYQEKPVIWDPKNPQYYKKNLKHDAWSDIAHSLERDVEECKNKMISLLASHRREKGKVKKSHSSGKGGDETYKSTWFAYEALAFLGDRNNPRKRRNTEFRIYITKWSGPQKKKSDENKKMGMLSEALGLLKSAASSPTPEPRNNNPNNFDSETLFFSNFICSKMQQYNRSTKNAVQRAIMDVIFKADEGCTNFSQHYYPSAFNYSGYTTGSVPSSRYCNEPPSLSNRSELTSGYSTGQNQTSCPTAPYASPVPSELSQTSYEDVDFVNDLI
ncbi:hypothetical protein HW555_012893 [Spodoptera exigua]|uniref:MADF domain-containing protein n=1 Tax=Spodoptera exigua TaxID=7107 RepID=A0A835G2N5_SPOEX|nr:hypothetical protein HW555_012893 [Spodoptera exigua]